MKYKRPFLSLLCSAAMLLWSCICFAAPDLTSGLLNKDHITTVFSVPDMNALQGMNDNLGKLSGQSDPAIISQLTAPFESLTVRMSMNEKNAVENLLLSMPMKQGADLKTLLNFIAAVLKLEPFSIVSPKDGELTPLGSKPFLDTNLYFALLKNTRGSFLLAANRPDLLTAMTQNINPPAEQLDNRFSDPVRVQLRFPPSTLENTFKMPLLIDFGVTQLDQLLTIHISTNALSLTTEAVPLLKNYQSKPFSAPKLYGTGTLYGCLTFQIPGIPDNLLEQLSLTAKQREEFQDAVTQVKEATGLELVDIISLLKGPNTLVFQGTIPLPGCPVPGLVLHMSGANPKVYEAINRAVQQYLVPTGVKPVPFSGNGWAGISIPVPIIPLSLTAVYGSEGLLLTTLPVESLSGALSPSISKEISATVNAGHGLSAALDVTSSLKLADSMRQAFGDLDNDDEEQLANVYNALAPWKAITAFWDEPEVLTLQLYPEANPPHWNVEPVSDKKSEVLTSGDEQEEKPEPLVYLPRMQKLMSDIFTDIIPDNETGKLSMHFGNIKLALTEENEGDHELVFSCCFTISTAQMSEDQARQLEESWNNKDNGSQLEIDVQDKNIDIWLTSTMTPEKGTLDEQLKTFAETYRDHLTNLMKNLKWK